MVVTQNTHARAFQGGEDGHARALTLSNKPRLSVSRVSSPGACSYAACACVVSVLYGG